MERKRTLNKALRNNRIEIVGFYRFCSPRKSHAWRIKKEGGEGKMGGKTDTKHGDIAIFNSRPSMSLYEQGRTWRQRVYESCIHTNSTFSGCCFPGFACVCVCVCARLLLSLHHDFEYAWLDVLPRRCCSKNSTIIFSISAEARFFFSFFSIDSSSRWCTTWISTDERKEKSCNIDRIHVLRDEIPPAWRNFEFYVLIHPLVEQRADGSSETV